MSGKKKPLSCQSKHVCIVIRKGKTIPLEKIKEYCIENFERYAFICHENHIDASTGVIIPIHYHIVGDFIGSKIPFSTRLNTLCNFFKFDNLNGIEIDQYRTFEGSLQYLTHKNQLDKTQVSKDLIIHNLSEQDFEILYNADVGNVITFDLLYLSCYQANNIIDVIKELGIGNYKLYRNVIWDIWNCLNNKDDYYKKLV